MTARVLRPVITLTTVIGILVAAIAVYAFLTTGTTRADSTYRPTTAVKYCNDLPNPFPPDTSMNGGAGACSEAGEPATMGLIAGGHPNYTTTLDMVTGDLNFSNVVTFTPITQTITAGGSIAAGDKVGGLHSETRLGTLNQPCNVLFPVDFVFFNTALPNMVGGRVDTSTNITWAQPEGTSVRFGRWGAPGAGPIGAGGGDAVTTSGFGSLVADGSNHAFQGYPHHLVRVFDRDTVPADGGLDSLLPFAVYGALTKVAGTEWVPLYFVQFAAGGLSTASGPPLSSFTSAEGQPSVSVLQDPSATQASPSTITDFCTPLNVTTMLLGASVPGATNRLTNGAAGTQFNEQYNASLRDTDQDSMENALDTCPLNVNLNNALGPSPTPAGNARISLAGDADNDGINVACDPSDAGGPNDFDGDGFDNRQDNCPLVSNVTQAEAELTTGSAADSGPRTDSIGDDCDSEGGTVSFVQNCNAGVYGGGYVVPFGKGTPVPTPPPYTPCATPNVSITMSDSVGNGRYMTVTNTVPKCIEASLPIDQDVDGDGYCIAQDTADSGICATQSPPSCYTRHNQWSGATHPALQTDTDGDHQSDALETYVGTDPVQPCSQNSGNNNEPMDNWMFDMTDNQLVNGGDSGLFAAPAFGANIVNGPFGIPVRPGNRFDFNSDGQITGQDTGKFGVYSPAYIGGTTSGPFNKSCTIAGVAAFSQQ